MARIAHDKEETMWHGAVGKGKGWKKPSVARECRSKARPGYDSMDASEFLDHDDVLKAKIEALAKLLRASKKCLAYTGAGISTSSGISDYATKARNSLAKEGVKIKLRSPMDAEPTLAHRAMVALYRAGHLKHWVQQNHDGLPQKAGYPQCALNEIHGAWFDPSNPVVPMSGTLRADLFRWLRIWENTADFTLALGSSLSGMSADRLVSSVAMRMREGSALGACIISLQRTKHDAFSALRIFAPLNRVMRLLCDHMGLRLPLIPPDGPARQRETSPPPPRGVGEKKRTLQEEKKDKMMAAQTAASGDNGGSKQGQQQQQQQHVYTVPYAADGRRLKPGSAKELLRLDLRTGSKVVIASGPRRGDHGTVLGTSAQGHYRIQFMHEATRDYNDRSMRAAGESFRYPAVGFLGKWWLQGALDGSVDALPVVPLQGSCIEPLSQAAAGGGGGGDDLKDGAVSGYTEARHHCPHASSQKINHVRTPEQKAACALFRESQAIASCAACKRPGCGSVAAAGGGRGSEKENWMCLGCHMVLCGRFAKGHMKAHAVKTGHKVACGLRDLSFWCYGCDSYLHHLTIRKVYDAYQVLHVAKFGKPSPQPFGASAQQAEKRSLGLLAK